MAKQEYIKHLFENEEASLREISRKTGVSQQTAKKYGTRKSGTTSRL